MSDVGAFQPQGQTVLVGATALQVLSGAGTSGQAFRIRCLVAAYLTWGQTSAVSAAGAPSAGSPVSNTIGMFVNSVETFKLPANSYFISNVAAAFEITSGEGI